MASPDRLLHAGNESTESQPRMPRQGPGEAQDGESRGGPVSEPPAAVAAEPAPDPDLTLPLAQPIALTRGPRSHIVTLMDAAILIRDLEPFRQARPVGIGRPR
jgi:hypothetical protein